MVVGSVGEDFGWGKLSRVLLCGVARSGGCLVTLNPDEPDNQFAIFVWCFLVLRVVQGHPGGRQHCVLPVYSIRPDATVVPGGGQQPVYAIIPTLGRS